MSDQAPDMGNSVSQPNTLLEQLGISDPRLAQVLHLLSNSSGQSQAEMDEARAKRAMHVKRLEAEVRRLREVNRVLLRHSEYLAAAVGACPLCWGEETDCPDCEGQGGPGAFLPDRTCFQEFVRPVIDNIRTHRARLQARTREQSASQPAPSDRPPAESAPPEGTDQSST